ncbi:septal ring lytic transglycosylase RlpA family protein [Thermodesulfobacterium sp. TA1]|uniref:septal ring lytic transglycosylase RlpA family protein n=1 Tax=Thermodesulfobacterium sp. TA1 TaxID=2234087 RepID=UPI001231C30A|nr:septal ring lytic transglycosylase RlpA family protein [Thermodesulfobacterium sp. TA1]QER41915.1 septal ring lytic transglycosylase RlpA family protein [Thermodesulfobacterium sp. TA1]
MRKRWFWFLGFCFFLIGCAKPPKPLDFSQEYTFSGPSLNIPGWLKPYTINGKTYYPLPSAKGYEEICIASWYGPGFHGAFAASGEVYNMYEYTAAHKLLPMGTYLLVTNLENGKQVVVRVNDRGPFVGDRCLDLSYVAAKELDIIGKGTAKVKIVALGEGEIKDSQMVYTHIPNFYKGEFYLQVGSFRHKENALQYKRQLEKEFSKVEIEPFIKGDCIFYRVQIFLSDDLNQALSLYQNLKKQRFKGAFLVAR